jgi:hypothetical protein
MLLLWGAFHMIGCFHNCNVKVLPCSDNIIQSVTHTHTHTHTPNPVAFYHTLVSNAKHADEKKSPFTDVVCTPLGNNSLKLIRLQQLVNAFMIAAIRC